MPLKNGFHKLEFLTLLLKIGIYQLPSVFGFVEPLSFGQALKLQALVFGQVDHYGVVVFIHGYASKKARTNPGTRRGSQ